MRKDQRTVLVGDDEPLLLMDAAAMLSDADFKVLEATNADEAIAIQESPCSVWAILIDVDMPGSMDGLRLAHAVKDRWPPVHIFVMSGHQIIDVDDMPPGGRFFAKPYNHREVVAAFHSALRG